VWLIGRDDNFIGQILMVFGVKRRTKEKKEKRVFSKMNCG
jgi:hypothetical protein